jgi:probable HAF family extracellular repeat protein
MRDLGALAGGESEAHAINDADVIVGYSTVASGAQRAVRWQNGKILNLGSLGGRNSQATGINDVGVIVGWSQTTSGARHAFVWQGGVMKDLGTLGGRNSQAIGINHAGKIVGWSETASGKRHVASWKNGVISDLGTHGHQSAGAAAVNNPGQIAGSLGPAPDDVLDAAYPFIFLAGTWTVFGTRQVESFATAINNAGVVAGYDADYRDAAASENPWVRAADGTLRYLPELTATSTSNAQAQGINKYGTIVGSSSNKAGWQVAVLWRQP